MPREHSAAARAKGSSARVKGDPMRICFRLQKSASAFVLVSTLVLGAIERPANAEPDGSRIAWSACFGEFGFPFECGTVRVPLDYSHGKALITIAVLRLPATDRRHRIGSIFLNPGGPGGSGVDFARDAGPFLFSEEV